MRNSIRTSIFLALLAGCTPVSSAEADFCSELRDSDKKLNEKYQSVLKDAAYAKDPEFLKAFKKSQQAWLRFRDLALEARYPAKDKRVDYGTAYRDCSCSETKRLTDARVADLELWTRGIEEGDVCTGSVKQK